MWISEFCYQNIYSNMVNFLWFCYEIIVQIYLFIYLREKERWVVSETHGTTSFHGPLQMGEKRKWKMAHTRFSEEETTSFNQYKWHKPQKRYYVGSKMISLSFNNIIYIHIICGQSLLGYLNKKILLFVVYFCQFLLYHEFIIFLIKYILTISIIS